jgi:hypothetical protein
MNDRLASGLTAPVLVAIGALGLAALSSCGDEGSADSGTETSPSAVDEVGRHGGEVCPDQLPLGLREGGGEPAGETPDLPVPEDAWVCVYDHVDEEPSEGGEASFAWVRHGDPHEVPADRMASVADALTHLVPADPDRMCTLELGPRYLLSYTTGTDLTGVVIDRFGCRDVRLTDEPFETAPGDVSQPGIPGGVLQAPPALLAELERVAR